MKKLRASFFDYLFLIRPTLLIPVWTFLLLGYYWGERIGEFRVRSAEWGVWNFALRIPTSEFLWTFLLYSLLMSGVYILNQIADRATDRTNQKLFLLSEGTVPVSSALLEMGLLLLVSLSLTIVLFNFSWLTGFVLLSLLMGILYSTSPIKAKGRPFIDLLWNSVGFGFVNFSIGWLAVAPFSLSTLYHSIPYVFSVGGVFLNTTIPDMTGDEKAGNRTTGVLLGKKKTGLLSAIFLFMALLSSVLFKDLICFTASLLALPFFLIAILKDKMRYYFLSIRIGAPLLVLLTVLLFPLYLPLLVITYFSLRGYYKKRFDYLYPSLLSKK